MAIRQSVSWWCVQNRGVENDALLRQVKSLGFAGVELIGREHFARARDCGLEIVSHMGHQSIGDGLNDPANHDRIESEIHRNLELAAEYGIANLIVFSGNRRAGLTDDEGADHTAACLARVAKAAEDAGVTLILELLNSRVDHPGYQCDRTAWGVDVCKRTGSSRVRLLYDIYHAQIMEGDLIRTIESSHGFIGHYHTAGNPGRRDLDDNQEIHYPAVFRAIARTGYDGWIGHEFIPHGDVVAALTAAYGITSSAVS